MKTSPQLSLFPDIAPVPSVLDRGAFTTEMTGHALVETLGPLRYVFGRWGSVFGCWRVEENAGSEEAVPRWRILDPAGNFLQEADGNFSMLNDFEHRFEGEEREGFDEVGCEHPFAIHDPQVDYRVEPLADPRVWKVYLSYIPLTIRETAARFERFQWLALEAMRENARFLWDFQDRKFVRFTEAIFLLAEADCQNRRDRRKLYGMLSSAPRAEVLSTYVPWTARKRDVRILERAELHGMTKHDLMQVLRANLRLGATNPLSHPPVLGWNTAMCVGFLPDWALHPKMLMAQLPADPDDVIDTSTNLHQIDSILHRVSNADEFEEVRKRIEDVFRSIDPRDDVHSLALRIVRAISRFDLRVPPDEIEYRAPLFPIITFEDAKREAHEMRNCLVDQFHDAFIFDEFYFSWRGRERATVAISKGLRGWEVCEITGIENSEVSSDELRKIEDAFRGTVLL